MGELEDYYRRKDAEAASTRMTFHTAYNSLVGVWLELRGLMLTGINRQPPTHSHEWLRLNGQDVVCWQLWVSYDYDDFLYFTSDGRIVRTQEHHRNPRVLTISRIPETSGVRAVNASGRANLFILKDLCNAAMSLCTNYNRDIPQHPHWNQWRRAIDAVHPQGYAE